ncbi:DUF3017 domain-containing protein [Streptomyces tsukubensis]|uniref:DUF3017 domain-containing protein n=1 Tax=Streptomyces tsukubensis (strain DSM 42081 / NBRC 108919 / NRRL 18488 / 9993) TaxID=1114943 RepID=A0A7G3UC57_STRT9|nr:DUF3017 domain-containing protein [Streptomyces tsukubensis]AZK96052.1 hypothetical protein B7R87_20930 [Streptomyces tsukubensis]QKM67926.1 hypothetical protein STSU_012850 [Streptomyces tsukubensis NRRL18488]TAI44324.1 DUF3017 domain-containing protein [Streptomyces tsukubensis]
MAVRTNDDRETGAGTGDGERPPAAADGPAQDIGGDGSGASAAGSGSSGTDPGPGPDTDRDAAAADAPSGESPDGTSGESGGTSGEASGGPSGAGGEAAGADADAEADTGGDSDSASDSGSGSGAGGDSTGSGTGSSRRPPALTTDTARPEGGGRAAPGDAPAPARQWPLLTVLGLVGLGLVIVGLDPFPEASRVGMLLIGLSLIGAAVMRRMIPSVGMLAVRSRFTDMATYGVLGTVISLLALMVQPEPWLQVPFLEDVVHFLVGRETD